ncbi:oxidoreductase [Flavobacterium seoulense]|uniref:Short-chain dehydrogenase n=1 Tax=Flavobacterium seoulense TaxID=1492738 RepID=A0A066WNB0_9FLAO|nr:oxidoreductase [Flavobacterium seoulense]KDN55321.1 short-chain dehydrogenase [Flavobacterium seoulense]
MNNRLENKIIIITGGNGLLGKAIVNRLISEGAFCVNFEINHETNEDLSNVYCDITDTSSIDKAFELVLKKYNKIDGLVNNAYPRTKDWGNKFEDILFDSWKQNIDWQLNSYFYLTQKVASQMASQKNGSIINMASIYGVVGADFNVYEGTTMTMPAAYSAIKGALVNFTRYVASYFGPLQVRVNTVSPGGIFDNQNEIFVNNYCKKVPMRRLGTPEDIAPTVAFLLSDDSQYITGQNLIVDGGWTAI